MKTQKKASVKAVAFCSKLEGRELPKATTWEDLTDIVYKHFEYSYDLYTHCKSQGDNTTITIYSGQSSELLEKFNYPNSEIFFEDEGDWDWALIYKILVEYFMKNWKHIQKGVKQSPSKGTKKKKQEPVDTKALKARVNELKRLIKTATGSEKKALIKEYNIKSQQLETESEKK